MTTEITTTGGFVGDPAQAFTPPARADGCCGAPGAVGDPAATSMCCGTAADADAAASCCAPAAKAEAVAAGTGCCG